MKKGILTVLIVVIVAISCSGIVFAMSVLNDEDSAKAIYEKKGTLLAAGNLDEVKETETTTQAKETQTTEAKAEDAATENNETTTQSETSDNAESIVNPGSSEDGWQEIDGRLYYYKNQELLRGPLTPGGTVTALGITVPVDTRRTDLKMEEVSDFTGHISQDGSWEWIDASQTTPQRGDIVVYYNPHEQYYAASHICVCVTDYNGHVYKAVDGNYGNGDGNVRSGFGPDETPNKGWLDSFQDEKDGYQNQETAMGVWRSAKYAEQMASAAEAILAEFKAVGQETWLEMYIPESYYGSWCFYLIPAVVAQAAK